MLCTLVIVPVLRPASARVVAAFFCVIPVTSGTLMSPLLPPKAPSAYAAPSAMSAATTTSRIQSHALLRRGGGGGSTTWAERSTRSMSAWNCAAVPRAPGSLESARITICDSSGGTCGLSSCGGWTTPSSCSRATRAPSAPSKTWRPVSMR